MRTIYKLNDLSFSSGIRAEYINENFDLIKRWIDSERKRSAGWGIVEGFDLEKDLVNYKIKVGSGIIINADGEELRVDENTFTVGAPTYVTLQETYIVDSEGRIELRFCPYSNEEKHTITYDGVEHKTFSDKELTVYDENTGRNLTKNNIRNISQNVILVNKDFAGDTVKVTYLYSNDRIDAIMLKKDGSEYIYEKGIISTSPSQQVIKDYLENGYYLIGFAYWHIGTEIDVSFITTDRTLRPIYVNEENKLFLNGKPYEGNKFINFTEPEFPEENDLWYSVEDNILYIYRPDEEGNKRWTAVNDLSRFHREVGYFTEEENPDDLQTFLFDSKPNLRFVPGKNQLTIIIDNIVLMRDMYEELYDSSIADKNDMTGYGFKLVEPLDRATVIEVNVEHSLNTTGHTEDLFEKIACFIYDDTLDLTADKVQDKFYKLEADYQIGMCQLELWRNGKKLVRGEDFFEAVKDTALRQASGEDSRSVSNLVYIESANAQDKITYKITRHMASFDNFRKYVDDWEARIKAIEQSEAAIKKNVDDFETNAGKKITTLESKMSTAETDISNLKRDCFSSAKKIVAENLSDSLRSGITKSVEYLNQNIQKTFVVDNTKITDFLSIYYIYNDTSLILRRDTDYLVSNAGDNIQITITNNAVLKNAGWAELYIELIRFGV